MDTYWMSMLGGQVRYIDVGGVSTRVLESGDPNSKTTVLMLHGASGHNENFVGNVVPMQSAGHLLAPDLLGHGLNSRPAGIDYSLDAVIKHIESLITTLGAKDVALVGLSLGGLVACHVAARHPKVVTKLVLACSGGIMPDGPAQPPIHRLSEGTKNLFANPSQDAVRSRFERMINLPETLSSEMVECREYFLRYPGAEETVVSVLADYDDNRDKYDAGPSLLGSIAAKTLYCWGAFNDPKPDVAKRAAALQPDASVEVFESSGHWPHVEEADHFNSIVLDFLKK